MALQTSGQISFENIRAEFGGVTPIRITDYYRGGTYVPDTTTNSGVPTSGEIRITDFYGASNTAPQILYSQILAFGSDATTACSNYNSNSGGTYYIDTPNFIDATVLYTDSSGTNLAFGSIYSDGQSWRNWSGSSFTQNGICSLSV